MDIVAENTGKICTTAAGHSRRKLGTFQSTMLLWNQMHAYNAVHLVKIARPLDGRKLEAVIGQRLAHYGLGLLDLDLVKRRYSFIEGCVPVEVRIVPGDSANLTEEIQRQLNTGFPIDRPFLPFRFFAQSCGDSFQLGLTYCHFVCDAAPLLHLAKDIASVYCDRPGPREKLDMSLPGAFPLWLAVKCLPRWLAGVVRRRGALKQSSKPLFGDLTNCEIGLTFAQLGPEAMGKLVGASKAWKVSVNDVFLAALTKVMSPLASKRTRKRRTQISVSSIVNTRQDLCGGGDVKFGLYLGTLLATLGLPVAISLGETAKNIHLQTGVAKERKLYLETLMELRVVNWLMPLFSKARQQKLYREHYPLWGGTSNMNLNEMARSHAGVIEDYVRAVSTGPICPLVLSLTTFNDRLNIGISYRKTVFCQEQVEQIVSQLTQCLSDPFGA